MCLNVLTSICTLLVVVLAGAPDRPADPGAASSSDPSGSVEARRGPDTRPRVRRTWADTGAGIGEGPDWSSSILAELFEH